MTFLKKCVAYSLKDSKPNIQPQKILRTFFDIRNSRPVENVYLHNKKQVAKREVMKQIKHVQKYQQILFGIRPRNGSIVTKFVQEPSGSFRKHLGMDKKKN